jgi:hypothetical protein
LLHEVGGSGTIVDFTDFMDFASEGEDALGGGSLARVYVGENTNVAITGDVFSHNCFSGFSSIGRW